MPDAPPPPPVEECTICLAGAATVGPPVCDGPTPAPEVSAEAPAPDRLKASRDAFGLACFLVGHGRAAVAGHVALTRAGRIVAPGPVVRLFGSPLHPCVRALIAASPGSGLGRRRDRAAVAGGAGAPPDRPAPCTCGGGDRAPPPIGAAPAHYVRIAA
jgi:ABC-type dipeptide/oligopeptide/nickel transport system ATPase component